MFAKFICLHYDKTFDQSCLYPILIDRNLKRIIFKMKIIDIQKLIDEQYAIEKVINSK